MVLFTEELPIERTKTTRHWEQMNNFGKWRTWFSFRLAIQSSLFTKIVAGMAALVKIDNSSGTVDRRLKWSIWKLPRKDLNKNFYRMTWNDEESFGSWRPCRSICNQTKPKELNIFWKIERLSKIKIYKMWLHNEECLNWP